MFYCRMLTELFSPGVPTLRNSTLLPRPDNVVMFYKKKGLYIWKIARAKYLKTFISVLMRGEMNQTLCWLVERPSHRGSFIITTFVFSFLSTPAIYCFLWR